MTRVVAGLYELMTGDDWSDKGKSNGRNQRFSFND